MRAQPHYLALCNDPVSESLGTSVNHTAVVIRHGVGSDDDDDNDEDDDREVLGDRGFWESGHDDGGGVKLLLLTSVSRNCRLLVETSRNSVNFPNRNFIDIAEFRYGLTASDPKPSIQRVL